MTDNPNYRKYLESEFSAVNKTLDRIENHLLEGDKKVEEIEEDIVNLKLEGVKHVMNCPVMPKVAVIEESLLEYKFFRKYPKLVVFVITSLILLTLYKMYIKEPIFRQELETKLTNEIRDQEGISKVTRSGVINYVDIDGRRDSINIRNARESFKKTKELERRYHE